MEKAIFLILIMILTTNMAMAQKYVIKVNGNETTQTSIKYDGIGFNNNKITLKANVNGHKIRIKSPVLSKNKYLKLINIS